MYFVDREKMEHTLLYIEENIALYQQHDFWNSSIEKKALERIAVAIIEGILDVGNAMIDGFIMRDPGSYEDIIDILEDEKVVTSDMAQQLKRLVRLRKTLVQEYLLISHEEVKTCLTDVQETIVGFCRAVRIYLENELGPVSAFKK
ncbi:DUF86 domain-containing protein [Bacillus sp. CHD6a]|uniref:DUF86 domain-containing protein n=1 Tax=Bacillus sp. CHD6a TaxID=1643452 RepID=UPI0006CD2DA7|nr:DUF86 domain-containing protein [Bacillus sp. CHD6a]KPB04706.1 hypothetical protein AAV98_10325 [Bacillus sp. CHD6a]